MSTPRASRCSSAAGATPRDQGRGAAEGDAGRGDAGRRRLAGPRRRRRAARPLLRRRHDRHRSRADRLRHRARAWQRRFAFERPGALARSARRLARAARGGACARACAAVPIFASDVSFRMTDFASRNAERAGVMSATLKAIEFKTADALQRLPPVARGTLMLNPPYGERIAAKGSGATRQREDFAGGGTPAAFFAALAAHWKRTLRRLDGLGAEPRHEAAGADAAEGERGACRCGTARSNAGCSASTWWPARRAAESPSRRLQCLRAAPRCAHVGRGRRLSSTLSATRARPTPPAVPCRRAARARRATR